MDGKNTKYYQIIICSADLQSLLFMHLERNIGFNVARSIQDICPFMKICFEV